MPELPWVKWFPQLWLSETGLALCSAATRGIWADALNHMLVSGTDSVTGTREQLASLCRCRPQEIEVAAIELKKFKVAVVTEQEGSTTLANRRLQRLFSERELKRKGGLARAAQRQQDASRSRPARSPSPSTSSSVSREGMQGEGVKIPSWDEWWAICQFVGLPEWKARDEFHKQESKDDPWKDARGNLNARAARVKTFWESDGRPEAPKSFHRTNGEALQWQSQKQYDLVCKEIKAIEDRASHTAMDMIVEPQDKERYKNLKQQRAELRKTLRL